MIPLTLNIQKRQVHRDREQMSGCQGLEEVENGKIANGYKVSFWGDEKF